MARSAKARVGKLLMHTRLLHNASRWAQELGCTQGLLALLQEYAADLFPRVARHLGLRAIEQGSRARGRAADNEGVIPLLHSIFLCVTLLLHALPPLLPDEAEPVLEIFSFLSPFQLSSLTEFGLLLAESKALLLSPPSRLHSFLQHRILASPLLPDDADHHRAAFFLLLLVQPQPHQPRLVEALNPSQIAALLNRLFSALSSPALPLNSAVHAVFSSLYSLDPDLPSCPLTRLLRQQSFLLYARTSLDHFPRCTRALLLMNCFDAYLRHASQRDPVVLVAVDLLAARVRSLCALRSPDMDQQAALLSIVLFRLLLVVDVAVLPLLLPKMEEVLRHAPSLPMKERLLNEIYRLFSTNYDHTRKDVLVDWYLRVFGIHGPSAPPELLYHFDDQLDQV